MSSYQANSNSNNSSSNAGAATPGGGGEGGASDTRFCVPGFGYFGTMIDLGVDLAPVRQQIHECKLRYHRELWDIICERGMQAGGKSGKGGGGKGGEDGDGGGGKGGEDGGGGGGGGGGSEGGMEDPPPPDDGNDEANQSNTTTGGWVRRRQCSSSQNNYHNYHEQQQHQQQQRLGGGHNLVGHVGLRGGSGARSESRRRTAAAICGASKASVITDSIADQLHPQRHHQQHQQPRFNGAQLAHSSRLASQPNFTRLKAQLPSCSPVPSSGCSSSNCSSGGGGGGGGSSSSSRLRGTLPTGLVGGRKQVVETADDLLAASTAATGTFVPLYCGDWASCSAAVKKSSASSSKRQHKRAAKAQQKQQQQAQK